MTLRSPQEVPRVLISGATGFIGSHVLAAMMKADYRVRVIGRRSARISDPRVEEFLVDDLADTRAVQPAFHGVDWVIHAAGLAHEEGGGDDESLALYQRANVATARAFAESAISAGASA